MADMAEVAIQTSGRHQRLRGLGLQPLVFLEKILGRQLEQIGIGTDVTTHKRRRRQPRKVILLKGTNDIGAQPQDIRHLIEIEPLRLALGTQTRPRRRASRSPAGLLGGLMLR